MHVDKYVNMERVKYEERSFNSLGVINYTSDRIPKVARNESLLEIKTAVTSKRLEGSARYFNMTFVARSSTYLR